MLVQKQICCYTYVTRFVKTIPNITTSSQTQAMVIPINWPVSLISLLLPRHFSYHLHHNWLSGLWVHVVAQNKQPTNQLWITRQLTCYVNHQLGYILWCPGFKHTLTETVHFAMSICEQSFYSPLFSCYDPYTHHSPVCECL